jgi:hypothetical protein
MVSVTLRQPLEAHPLLARAKNGCHASELSTDVRIAYHIPEGAVVRIMGRVEGEQRQSGTRVPLKLAMLVSYKGVEGIVTATDFEKVDG